MLEITVGAEGFDESTGKFTVVDGQTLQLEHSLVSVSKWEGTFEKPFLEQRVKTAEETLAYIHAMLLTPGVPEEFLLSLSQTNFEEINAYIAAKRTATWFSEIKGKPTSEIVTAELIYYWMTVFHIPFECESWHLNRLFTLIRICNLKQEKPKKMSAGEMARRNAELNAKRKAQMGTKG